MDTEVARQLVDVLITLCAKPDVTTEELDNAIVENGGSELREDILWGVPMGKLEKDDREKVLARLMAKRRELHQSDRAAAA